MLGESHDLLHEFPEHAERIASLRDSDAEFRTLMEEYNWLDSQVRSLEEHDQPVADTHMDAMKKRRVQLKDKLYRILTAS